MGKKEPREATAVLDLWLVAFYHGDWLSRTRLGKHEQMCIREPSVSLVLPDRTTPVWRLWDGKDREYPNVDEVHAHSGLFRGRPSSLNDRGIHAGRAACYEFRKQWNAVRWTLWNNLSPLSLFSHRLSSRASLISLSNRRTRKRVKRGLEDDGRGARGGFVHVLGLRACSGLFGPLCRA